ncbi:Tat (twin-arginine translocation) pathway signal sequence domain-containing protein [Alcanivorax sp. S71-1-4]|uniref:PhoX family protein n=1 Tax=Alcanivorax sp. S71-1-4 TaxID=1177159 RepID=UPI001359906D|nr:PhoX family phosphatase [Alcanivorax sp. S71-1-4]KAF0804460.1 Tat (twin-arginine translocation) pathway signal sequence domain-containing protein [Alcanivorax sp. S71-1-4]
MNSKFEQPNTVLDGNIPEPCANQSDNRHFADIIQARFSRRAMLQGSLGVAAVGFLGGTLAACGGDSSSSRRKAGLGFEAIPAGRDDAIVVPEGYTARAFLPWGTPILGSMPAYMDDGSNTGADQAEQMGSHHDGIHYFPIDDSSDHGLLVMNHEYVDKKVIHAAGPSARPRPLDEVRKEMNAHGVSVVEIQKSANGEWEMLNNGRNRRITAFTEMEIAGPARGSELLATAFSPNATRTRGTLNNCGSGFTPWGTYLISEENWAGYFHPDASIDPMPRELARYSVSGWQGNFWYDAQEGGVVTADDNFSRFLTAATGADASEDFRNEPNNFGWLVEFDPFDPNSVPKKRTAMGRFAHEGVVPVQAVVGKPVVFYSGDDSTNEYVYKYVSNANYEEGMTGDDLLDDGTLYVARFNDDGTGEWLALDFDDVGFQADMSESPIKFTSQADVLVNTRSAADMRGATPMDRPEWGAVNPVTNEVYFTLTNNSGRQVADEANPRVLNRTGHIIRWNEDGEPAAAAFTWDIFVFGGRDQQHLKGYVPSAGEYLDEDNYFASPDGLLYDESGILWIQTDMSGSQQDGSGPDGDFGNNQMLAAIPETGEIKRFLVGPMDCEVTGVTLTPDHKTMFINIQHPGDRSEPGNFTSHWPSGMAGARPRSSTVVITKDDGGVIGL